MKQRFVVVDLETTGNSPKKQDKIIQVGAVLIEDGEIIERFASFVNPLCEIPPFIEQLTNISNDMVRHAPTFEQIAPMLKEMLEGAALVAHNVPFDLSFLQHELQECGYPGFSGNTIDTVELARILLPTLNKYKLTDLADFYELDHENPHRADSDAEATAVIFLNLLNKIATLQSKTKQQLQHLLYNMKSDIYILFSHNDGDEVKDLNKDIVLYKDKIVLKKQQQSTDAVDVPYLLKKIQNTANKIDLPTEVKKLFQSRQHGLFEISAGGNNENCYLEGALLFALETGKKIVISSFVHETAQKIMQKIKQLTNVEKESSTIWTTIKGKYYYLSLPRFYSALEEVDDNYDSVLTKAQILVWLTETETGDMEELSLSSGGRLLWDAINCSYIVKGSENHEYCFYKKAYEKVKDSSIIFTNHAYLAKEIWNPDVLAEVDYFIVDDSNIFYQNVSRFLGKEISYLDFYFALSKLGDHPLIYQTREELDDTFRILRSFCLSRTKNHSGRISYRYDILQEKGASWFAVQEAGQRLYMKLKNVIQMLAGKSSSNIKNQDIAYLQEMRDTFYSLLFVPEPNRLTWLEVNARGPQNAVSIYEQPLDISIHLAEKFYQEKSSVIFVSQALSVKENFDYSIEELGLADFYPKTMSFANDASPSISGVYVPTDMPVLAKRNNEQFIQTAAMQVRELLAFKKGRILVAFSAIEMLSQFYSEIKNMPELYDTVIVSQSSISGGKQKILKAAANFENAILLVTNSFLEEVSLVNEYIETLVIIRLPFQALDEPIMAAKIEKVEKQGRNSFTDISLPIAVLRFKKMIASFLEGNASKHIFIFDKRIIDKKYGEYFIGSIPSSNVKKDSFFSLLLSMK